MRGDKTLLIKDIEFEQIIEDIINNQTVQKMKNYNQHYDTSCYEHCKNVAYISYKICKKLKLDYKSAARAGMLHDLFLYDWRKRQDGRKGLHSAGQRTEAAFSCQKGYVRSSHRIPQGCGRRFL